MRIIGLSGFMSAGKDLVGALLVMLGYEQIAFADELRKEVQEAVFSGTPPTEMPEEIKAHFLRLVRFPEDVYRKPTQAHARCVLQWWGTEYRREQFGADYWVERLKSNLDPNKKYVITDIRFPNEADVCDVIFEIRRKRDRNSDGIPGHVSEIGVPGDFVIDNDGSQKDLALKVRKLVCED